ncbi:DUF2235 domain-containing protein [Cognatishimia maritima]|uniref:Uncharacterized alpha/beta hydrolase domain n=1 Tax=Cognatishimia maritima TaxID=870908 RepID=A0A1M5TSS7_9RHOB|nr:DUF2235 domain-containing protein [Cognatishimia maritima]SHH53463.1 Uncharacterized alpha/beta hydrolase domain [Cognatishimia maritima]
MRLPRWTLKLRTLFRRKVSEPQQGLAIRREPQIHVVILDGTMSSLAAGMQTNAGQTFQLLKEAVPPISLYYEAGVQFKKWKHAPDVMMGRGINRQIRRAYGFLASRYRPGDKIFLFGYSRGAFAVRSLAGVIDRVGLLQAKHATERNVQMAYRHYECAPDSDAAREFSKLFCHDAAEIEMIGVWDTVKALGLRLPLLWRLTEEKHAFHNHQLGNSVRHGYHALAIDENRLVYEPVLWDEPEGFTGRVEQMWFHGSHADVGGQLLGEEESRPLANIPLVWMLEKSEALGLPLPQGWQARFPQDATAPSVGTWTGWGKMFLLRKKREIGRDPSEAIHETAQRFMEKKEPRVAPLLRRLKGH